MNFDKESTCFFFFFFFFFGGGGGGGGGGWGALKPKQYAPECQIRYTAKKNNHLHSVEHVVQSTFRNMFITF